MDTSGAPSRQRFHGSKAKYWANKMAVEQTEEGLSTAQLMLINHDLKPVETARRVWGPWNFCGYWIADCLNINTLMIASSMTVSGMAWWQAWIAIICGYSFAGIFVVLVARIGAVYHISFPVVCRSSFGIWGSLFPVLNRTVMACVWYAVQAWLGGRCFYVMIHSIWKSWDRENIPTHAFSDTTTADFVSFFLFWLFSLPFLWLPVHKLRHLFTVKSYVVPVAGIALLAWTVSKAGGLGPIFRQPATIRGNDLAWAFVQGVMSSIANFATLVVNGCDFSRFAIKPRDALWSQLFTIPIGFACTSLVGIIVSSASAVIYNEAPVWDPLVVLERYVEHGNSAERFGVFVIALCFALAQLGTNIAANSISAGTDMTALAPRWVNIRRGSYVCAGLALAMCPWKLLSDSNQFTTYLSAYSVFLSSIAGVMCSDYYAVRRGYLIVTDLFNARKGSTYYYSYGIHWRAYVAYVAGILINFVGFVGELGVSVPIGATYVYRMNFFGGFAVSFSIYWALCHFFPVPGTSEKWLEVVFDMDEVRVAYDADSYSDKGVDSGHQKSDEEVSVDGKQKVLGGKSDPKNDEGIQKGTS